MNSSFLRLGALVLALASGLTLPAQRHAAPPPPTSRGPHEALRIELPRGGSLVIRIEIRTEAREEEAPLPPEAPEAAPEELPPAEEPAPAEEGQELEECGEVEECEELEECGELEALEECEARDESEECEEREECEECEEPAPRPALPTLPRITITIEIVLQAPKAPRRSIG